jgi:Potential Queuosine, Q, salvage protein family
MFDVGAELWHRQIFNGSGRGGCDRGSGTASSRSVEQLRQACGALAARARHVRIDEAALPAYATGLELPAAAPASAQSDADRGAETRAAFWITLDAINFGSGWFPTLRKRRGQSGYSTIAAALREHFDHAGPWSAQELTQLDAGALAGVLGQDPGHELMGLFARSLNDLGARIATEHDGSFAAVIDAARGSAPALAAHLSRWDCFADTSTYDELELPFLKRAQITAADLARAGVAAFDDLDRLTMFADNLVPHVLRLDGVLRFEDELVRRIEREELIEHGSAEEVEIRACALHAVELIAAVRLDTTAVAVDQFLWHRGQQPRYKGVPRHRSRCTAY